MPEESGILTSPFKKEKLFHLLRHLKISRASLLIEDETIEFIDLSDKAKLEYQVFPSGTVPKTITSEFVKGICPICGAKVIPFDSDEDIAGHFTQDYECSKCDFIGTQWFHKTFIGHTSSVYNQTIESFKNNHQQK